MRSDGGLAALAMALTFGCGATPPVVEPPPAAIPVPVEPSPPVDAPSTKTAWDCTGELVPPAGYLQATRFVDRRPGAVSAATSAALGALRAKVCTGPCAALSERFTVWKTGEGPERVCAMAVVKAEAVAGWKASTFTTARFDAALADAIAGLNLRGRTVIGQVSDAGARGGARARWLVPRLNRAISAAGGTVVAAPDGWSGTAPPSGIDASLTARLTPRAEGQIPVLEVALTAHVREGFGTLLRSAPPVLLAAAVAPHVDPLPSATPGDVVRVELDAPGAGVCGGDEVTLRVTAPRVMHVRVFDLYGADGALLLFAGRVPPGTAPIGGAFKAVPVAGSPAERFLVLAADDVGALGDFARRTETCRFPPDVGARLHRLDDLPATAHVSVDGFRITEGPPCSPIAAETRAAVETMLAEMKECAP